MEYHNFKNVVRIIMLAFLISTSYFVTAQDKFGGLALYTVRDSMEKNPKKTLQAVSDAGYSYIEAAGYKDGKFYGFSPKEFKAHLASLELIPLSTHQSSVSLENAASMMADVKAAGFEYFVVPVPPMGLFVNDDNGMDMKGGVENLATILTTLGKQAHALDLKLLYHNHDFEFVKDSNGFKVIDYLLENCDSKYVNFQMDLHWVTKAKADPLAYFEKYPGRFKLWHVKDMDSQGRFAPVGNGTIDFGRILNEKEQSGMQAYFVEQDETFAMEPLEAIKVSHKGLKRIGFN
jgi:sugar phosphate isomerase/epimerase